MTTTNAALREWVTQTAKLTQPEHIHWCTGSDTERDELVELVPGVYLGKILYNTGSGYFKLGYFALRIPR